MKQDIKEIAFKEQGEIEWFIQAQRREQSPFFQTEGGGQRGTLSWYLPPEIWCSQNKYLPEKWSFEIKCASFVLVQFSFFSHNTI